MTSSEVHAGPAIVAIASLRHARGGQVLADALAHLLARDGERPARWSMPAFALEVEVARTRLSAADSLAALQVAIADETEEAQIDFHVAAVRLARNPQDVALAIRRLELTRRTRLPPWDRLLQRGLTGWPTALDTSLWFG